MLISTINKIDNLIENYHTLISSVFSKGNEDSDGIYVSHGLVNMAIVSVKMPQDNLLPQAFIYAEGNRVFICISDSLDKQAKNLAKAYMLGLYLICESEITDGVYKNLYFYPTVPDTKASKDAMYFARNILLPKSNFVDSVLRISKEKTVDNVKPATVLSELADKYNVPKILVADRLRDVKRNSRAKGITYKTYTDEEIKPILRQLEKYVHVVSWDTFESSRVMIDVYSAYKAEKETCDEEANMSVSAEAEEAMHSNDTEAVDIYSEGMIKEDKDVSVTSVDIEYNLEKTAEFLDTLAKSILSIKDVADDYGKLLEEIENCKDEKKRIKLLDDFFNCAKACEAIYNNKSVSQMYKMFSSASYKDFRVRLETILEIFRGGKQ